MADHEFVDGPTTPFPFAGSARTPSKTWGWITRAGGYIRICDATLDHLKAMAKCIKEGRVTGGEDLYLPILAEISRRENR
jgi:hypothetical protein